MREPKCPDLTRMRTIVLKLGSAAMCASTFGRLRSEWLRTVARDVADFQRQYRARVVIMSSGALATGRAGLARAGRPPADDGADAAAGAVGQIRMAQAWQEALSTADLVAGQLLLTTRDFETEAPLRAIHALWRAGAVPCINENIPLQTTFDNDDLAVRVARVIEADLVVFVSDVDGLYTADPRWDETAMLRPVVIDITDEMVAEAGRASSALGTGGMAAKLAAARSAQRAGCHVVMMGARHDHPLASIRDGVACTWILARS